MKVKAAQARLSLSSRNRVALEILPFQGLGPLRLSQPRAEIRALLDVAYKTITKGHEKGRRRETELIDAYYDLGFHLYYDNDDRLEFIEAFSPCEPIFKGIQFLGRDIDDAVNEMDEAGYDYLEVDTGCDFIELGFVLYAPLGTVEGVSVYRKGYYGTR